jgi:tetratricopeptide (TPR) repeat protein/predicted amidohydrolase
MRDKMSKKKTKDKKIKRIIKLITHGKLDTALELADVNDVEDLLNIGARFGQNEVHDIAEKIFNRVIQLDPNLAEAWYNKGVTLGNLGKYDEAIKCYDAAIMINPNLAGAWSNKGVTLGNLGKYDEAIKCYDAAIKINPNLAEAWYNKGIALKNLEKYDEAIKCYDAAIKINPNDDDDVWYNKGITLENLGKYDEAIKCYDEAIMINPNLAEACSNKGVALGNFGKYDEAIKCYDEAIKINPNLADAWSNKGVALRNLGEYDEAIKCYDEAIRINPNLAEVLYNKGVALENLGKYDEAIKCYDEAIRINPNLAEVLYNKGVALGNLGKYDEAIKCYDEAIKINPNYDEAWSNKGVTLENLGKYDEAIKCYDAAIKINPNLAEAWSNKGVTLGNLGKYDEAIKCYDAAIMINPNLAEAWSNKGIALGNLGKYDEEIKCYDDAIKINSNLVEAYCNKGITLLNTRKYDEAKTELKTARKLFYKRGMKNDADKTYRYELLAINGSELMSRLKPLDEEFVNSLNSRSLTKLKESSLRISKSIEGVIKEFEKRDIPKEVAELLISKKNCFTALSNALKFEKVDLKAFEGEKRIFEKWNLDTFIIAINSLENFIRGLSRYKSLEEIPEDVEQFLLQVLHASYILDGVLTGEISDKIKGEPYPAKPMSIEKRPNIKYIRIPNIGKDCLRVCLVQLDFLLTEKFPYQLKTKEKVKEKILKALEIAKQKEVNIICFPELSFAREFISKVKKYDDIIIIGGSFYSDNFNICPVIISGKENHVYKIHPSPYLESEIAPGKGMKSGKDIKIFGTEDGKIKFGVLICFDYLKESYHLYQHQNNGKKGVNFIFNPSFNPNPERFQRQANVDCENYYLDLIQTNVKKYGGTCIIGVEHKDIIKRLINEGYRQDDDITYKLCEASGEMMIIADLNLKGVEVPTSLGAGPRIKMIGRYIYKNECWQE